MMVVISPRFGFRRGRGVAQGVVTQGDWICQPPRGLLCTRWKSRSPILPTYAASSSRSVPSWRCKPKEKLWVRGWAKFLAIESWLVQSRKVGPVAAGFNESQSARCWTTSLGLKGGSGYTLDGVPTTNGEIGPLCQATRAMLNAVGL